MVLVDTSVWIAHLRGETGALVPLLDEGEVICHPFVIGEIACGRLKNRAEVLGLLNALPAATLVRHEEALELLSRSRLVGKGIGWVDVHLLASSLVDRAGLLTLDGALQSAARIVGALYTRD